MHDIRHLQHFVAIMEHASISEAAARVHISQPALTKSLQRLEGSLGASLFDRSNGMTPTPLADHLFQKCKDLVNRFDDLKVETVHFLGSDHGALRIGAGPLMAELLVIPSINSLLNDRPKASIIMEVQNYQILPDMLRARSLDMIIADVSELRNQPDLDIIPIPKMPLIWVCRKDHPLASVARPKTSSMYDHSFAIPRPAGWGLDWLRQNMPRELRGKKEPEQFVSVSSNHLSTLYRVVLNSNAITVLTRSLLEVIPERDKFHILPIKAPAPYSNAGIVLLKERSLSPIGKALLKEIKEHMRVL